MQAEFSETHIKNCLEVGRKLLDGALFSEIYNDELMDSFNSLLFWKDRDSKFIGCNKKFAELGGVQNPQFIVGKCDYELAWQEEESKKYLKDDQEVFNFYKLKLNIEESMRQVNGNQVIILTSKFKVYSTDRKKFGLIGIATDITEHKILERRLLEINNNALVDPNISKGFVCMQLVETLNRLNEISEHIKINGKKYVYVYKNKQIMLTARQLQCLVLSLQGKTNKQIGKNLKLSSRTVEHYLKLVKEKFECATKNHLLEIILSSNGFIDCKE